MHDSSFTTRVTVPALVVSDAPLAAFGTAEGDAAFLMLSFIAGLDHRAARPATNFPITGKIDR
jgi:hypothetical protein